MNRKARVIGVGAGVAGVTAGLAALVADPSVRQLARQASRVARPLPPGAPRPPVPPPLPPGRVVSLPGRGEVFVRDSGTAGPVVLMLHGWTVSADLNFFPAYAPLAQAYRVVAMDLRGHGRGMRSAEAFTLEDCADDAAALLDQLGTGPVIALGYSMGGPVAMLLARRYPGRVTGLVMQATALEWRHTARERAVWRLLLPAFELGLQLGAGDRFVERSVHLVAEEQPGLDAWMPWLAAEFRRGLAGDLADAGRALSRYDASSWAADLALPAAMVITASDRLVRPAKQRDLAGALRAQVLEIDADHDLPLLRGAEYADLTRRAVDLVAAALAS